MSGFNFADNYRAAGLSTSGETIRLRHEAFESIRRDLDSTKTLDLTRIYFGIQAPSSLEWFRDAFAATDPAFSMVENEREAAVLAVGILDAEIQANNDAAGLAVLCTAFAGIRTPGVRPDFVASIPALLRRRQIATRQQISMCNIAIENQVPSRTSTSIAALLQSPDWPKAGVLFQQIYDDALDATTTLSEQLQNVIEPLVNEVNSLREESEMLWWHVGGWSSSLDRPLASLDIAAAAIVAGIDMADLTRSNLGPVAAAALLHRTIHSHRSAGAEQITVHGAIDALGTDDLAKLNLALLPNEMHDICPIGAALAKATEARGNSVWHSQYERVTGLSLTSQISPYEMAMQAYRERLLVAINK